MTDLTASQKLLWQRISELDGPLAAELGSLLECACKEVSLQLEKSKELASAQANAIVNSANIIAELEETKQSLEEARRESEANAERVRMLAAFGDIVDRSLSEIFICDAETLQLIHANHGARQNIGYSMEELCEMTPMDFVVGMDAKEMVAVVQQIVDGQVVESNTETWHRRKDGSQYPVEVRLETSTFGDRKVVVATVVDITQRLRIEQDLRLSQQRAMAADQLKSDFLANMSHEIRTPMTAILGFSENLLERDMPEVEKRNAIKTIQRNGRHLLSIINDILDLSKVEAGKLEVEQISMDLPALLHDLYELLIESAKDRDNQLHFEIQGFIPQQIKSDPTRLKQALVNLIGNAIKFTKKGYVRINVRFDAEQKLVQFDVIDTGSGMTESQLERIFKPFSQADTSTTRKFGGTGLGLVITKHIANLLGGDVLVESKSGEGSKFTLIVSTGDVKNAPMTSDAGYQRLKRKSDTHLFLPDEGVGKCQGRVLLVEDGPDNQRLISFILRKAGADVTVAENGKIGSETALQAVADGSPYDLILMDMQMPVMDGYTAAAHLRTNNYEGQIVALTAHAMKGEIDKCLASGCDGYLTKPIDRTVFLKEVSTRLRKQASRLVDSTSE